MNIINLIPGTVTLVLLVVTSFYIIPNIKTSLLRYHYVLLYTTMILTSIRPFTLSFDLLRVSEAPTTFFQSFKCYVEATLYIASTVSASVGSALICVNISIVVMFSLKKKSLRALGKAFISLYALLIIGIIANYYLAKQIGYSPLFELCYFVDIRKVMVINLTHFFSIVLVTFTVIFFGVIYFIRARRVRRYRKLLAACALYALIPYLLFICVHWDIKVFSKARTFMLYFQRSAASLYFLVYLLLERRSKSQKKLFSTDYQAMQFLEVRKMFLVYLKEYGKRRCELILDVFEKLVALKDEEEFQTELADLVENREELLAGYEGMGREIVLRDIVSSMKVELKEFFATGEFKRYEAKKIVETEEIDMAFMRQEY